MTVLDNVVAVPLGFGDLAVTIGDHIAHFYQSKEEMFAVFTPYIVEGIRRGDTCVVITVPQGAGELGRWLGPDRLGGHRAGEVGQVLVETGVANLQEMRARLERIAIDALAPANVVRLAWDGNWFPNRLASPVDLLRFEVLYEELSGRWGGRRLALCQLDLTRFGGDMVMEAFRAHHLCIMGRILVRSPLHLSPKSLLKTLEERE